jgi:hypothetical protein
MQHFFSEHEKIDEISQALRDLVSKNRRPTFIEISTEHWNKIRKGLAERFPDGMRVRSAW